MAKVKYQLVAGSDRVGSDDLAALKRAGAAALKRGVRRVRIVGPGGKALLPLRRGAVLRWV